MEKSRLSVLVLSPIYLPERFGGIEVIVDGVIAALIDLGVDVTVLSASRNRGATDLQGPPQLRHATISGSFDSPEKTSSMNLSMRRLVKSKKFDIVYCNDWFFASVAVEIARMQRAPLVSIMHLCKAAEYSHVDLSGRRAWIAHSQQSLVDQSDVVVTYSDYMVELARVHWQVKPERLLRLYCGFTEVLHQRIPTQIRPLRSQRLLYAGRLAPEKDVEVLLRAFSMISSTLPATLRIVGSGAEEQRLLNLATGLGVAHRIEWFPFTQDSGTLERHFRDADALVLPSRFEPFGVVLLEAVARGIPVICSDAGGPAEIVRPDTGYVFPVGDAHALARSIAAMVSDPAEARARADLALIDCRERFSWRRASETLRAVETLVVGATR